MLYTDFVVCKRLTRKLQKQNYNVFNKTKRYYQVCKWRWYMQNNK
jgi:hypothetical protein